ncbi:metabotropic glutamate receptor 8 isoform X1 [Hydra vulgaris]|uniref:Metabotropic glutamate receptor 8 isoform X1 n=1 Tax=Hydra vulgaris TaxID=6087 RepID=A0ABM4CPK7_HYDVU
MWLFVILFLIFNSSLVDVKDSEIFISGNFVVHMISLNNSTCSRVNLDIGIPFMEAMIYAIESTKNISNFFPNGFKLSYIFNDLCESRSKVYNSIIKSNVAVGIGSYSSTSTEFWSRFLWVWNKCLISYGATSKIFSNRKKFSSLFTTLPLDNWTSLALIELSRKYNWNYVGIISTYNEDGKSMTYEYQEFMKKNDMCVAFSRTINKDAKQEEFFELITDLNNYYKTDRKPKTVFLFLTYEVCQRLFEAFASYTYSLNFFQFVIGTQCGTMASIPTAVQSLFEGLITLQVANPFPADFEKYFSGLNPTKKIGAVNEGFFREYWEALHQCSLNDYFSGCANRSHIGFNRFIPVRPVIKASFAAAYALKNWLFQNCVLCKPSCENTCKPSAINDLYNYIPNASDEYGKPFLNNIEDPENYEFFQYKRNLNNNFEFQRIGEWNFELYVKTNGTTGLIINETAITLPTPSVCSSACNKNQIQTTVIGCCWRCEYCDVSKEYVRNNSCIVCPIGSRPNILQDSCLKLPIVSIHSNSTLSFIVMTTSVFAMTCSVVIMVVYIQNKSAPVIKASSFEMAICSLVGIILMLVMPILFIQTPTEAYLCHIQKIVFGLSLTLCYSPLVLKTNRVYRIFTSSSKFKLRSLMLVSMKSQFLLITGMVGIQMVMAILWITNDVPTLIQTYNNVSGVQSCKITRESMTLNSLFPAVLIISCAVYAFKTRHLPETYSEIKSIGISMYFTLFIITICLVLIMLLGVKEFAGTYILCFTFQASAIVALIGQYAMKIIILFCKKNDEACPATFNYITSPTVSRLAMMGRVNSGYKIDTLDPIIFRDNRSESIPN